MKILCLHGFRNSGNLLNKSMLSLEKKVKKDNIYFDFITSPFLYKKTSSEPFDYEENTFYQWWSTSKEGLFNEENYDTLYESIEYIYKLVILNNYDGILGSSQGSVLTQIILFLQEYPLLFDEKFHKFKFSFKFGILGSTFNITDTSLKILYDYKINTPILNIYGKSDQLVPYELSKEFNKKCNNVTSYEHMGKHYIPTTTEMRKVLLDFLIKKKIEYK